MPSFALSNAFCASFTFCAASFTFCASGVLSATFFASSAAFWAAFSKNLFFASCAAFSAASPAAFSNTFVVDFSTIEFAAYFDHTYKPV